MRLVSTVTDRATTGTPSSIVLMLAVVIGIGLGCPGARAAGSRDDSVRPPGAGLVSGESSMALLAATVVGDAPQGPFLFGSQRYGPGSGRAGSAPVGIDGVPCTCLGQPARPCQCDADWKPAFATKSGAGARPVNTHRWTRVRRRLVMK
ncbi:MAG: hypothetical protein HY815_05830 [Candidatus Riflebacteria bacterium]|nr:hypothetical protein [Candidatus Riflebacteria bacterium]